MKDAPSSPFFLPSLLAAAMGFALLAPSAMAKDQTCLVEAEAFQFPFNWIVNKDSTCSNGAMLSTTSTEDDALTVIDLPAAGRYTLWARGRDFATDQQGSRRFRLVVDGVASEKEGGMHGRDGWYWEKLGTQELAQGRHILGLRDSSHLFPRCDAFLLTTGGFDPNTLPEGALDQYRITPVKARMTSPSFPLKSPELKATSRREVGHIENDLVRLRFVEAQDVNGQPVIVRETEVFSGGKWEKAPMKEGGETLSMLYSTASKFSMGGVFPVWNGSKATFDIEGKVGGIIRKNPFGAGERELLVPRSARMKDAGTAEVIYEAASGQKVVTQWTASPQRRDIAVTATFTAAKEGEYSLVFSPFQPWEKEQIEFNLLPPIFNYQRAPEAPFMQMSAMTPQALALVQATPQGSKERFSFAVVADPARLTFDWPDATNSAYGFSLLNGGGQVQPTLFTPILGLADSKLKAGEAKTVSWLLLVEPGDWKTALEDASSHIFKVTDYRHPYGTSLTDAAFNMVALMKDDRHSGWDATLKGFYNIESKGTVSQVSPLMMLSTALLTQDEDFYVKRALPSFEYTLSRPGAHFATVLPPTAPNYVSKETMKIHVPSEFFGTAYWQGVDDLFGRKNPWIAQYAFKDGKLRTPTSYASTPRWSEMLGAYRLDPKPELLAEIQKEATRFVQTEVYGRKTADIGTEPFINRSYYPYWWDLVDLYELTHDKQYLDAAEECAFHTVSDLWSQPSTPQGNHTINPGGQLPYTAYHWYWTGYERFRLGWPLSPEATREKQVPAWVLSRVGLGVEQYSTYCQPVSGPYRNIMMSAWSPNLLRVYQYTGREIFQTYARNSIIGRFGNYPGYYIQTYADAQLSPRYPLEGPDITDIYYHHIPAHLAFTVDFLVSEAAVRSKGQITFPWVKQQGYVWFTNRIYGHAPGKVYGDDEVSLYLNRDVVKVDSDQISTLAARGAGRFDLILMNEADTDLAPSIALDEKSLGIDAGQSYRVITNGKAKKQRGPVSGAVTIPAKGIAVISLPTRQQDAAREIPVLQTAPVEQKLGGDWGSLHAFRIRSPFGKDSLYAVLTGGKPGSKVRLVIDGDSNSPREVSSYPYEFSVYPIPMDKDLTFHLGLKDAAGVETQSKPVTLKGTR